MGELLSVVASHLSPPGDTTSHITNHIQPSISICHDVPPRHWNMLWTPSREYRVAVPVWGLDIYVSGSEDHGGELSQLSTKTGKPGWRLQVVAGAAGGGLAGDPGPVKMCPLFPRAAGGGGTTSVMLSLVIMIITPPPPPPATNYHQPPVVTSILDKKIY